MARIKMTVANDIIFYERCEEYVLDYKARNLRNGTLKPIYEREVYTFSACAYIIYD